MKKSIAKEMKSPKKITYKRLENIALYYLNRYESSTANLVAVLTRRIDKALKFHEFDREEAVSWAIQVAEKMQSYGYIDDKRYIENQVRILSNKGNSKKMIKQKLIAKGCLREDVEAGLSEDIDDYQLAMRFAEKKKIGPFAKREVTPEQRQKDMMKMARQGFSYDVILRLLHD